MLGGNEIPGVASNQAESRVPTVSEQTFTRLAWTKKGGNTYTAHGKLKAVMMPIVPIGFHTCALGCECSANKLGRAVHLDERVLRAFAGVHVAGHLSAHAAG